MEAEQFSVKRPTSKLPAAWKQRDTLEVCQGAGTRSAAFVAFLERYTSTTKINQSRFHNVTFQQWETQQAGLFYLAFSRDKK